MINKIQETSNYLKDKGFNAPEIGVILGTGLSNFPSEIEVLAEVSYNEIPHFPTATVEFHKGKLIFGNLEGKKVIVMQGRFHLYEGYAPEEVTYPVRVMKELGIRKLLVSNAAGATNLDFKNGELMLIVDHINLLGGSPLAFKGVEKLGERFIDMCDPYDLEMNSALEKIAKEHSIKLNKGVYASVLGPQLETRAEYRYLRIIGADAVGMSTIPEVIVAKHLNLPVSAISVITDEGNPDDLKPVDISEIIAMAEKAEPDMILLFKELIKII
ncbi:purine-nucleoside phosphorylase [Gillisia sp. Hel_I_86]|uniref:purine-nucleoside phosphorylase n=1 Tax=Gillisia sp. Hel_I_86 TaxID=1249981 RepID=UPI00119B0855|nr:purine-nucleoside phosphorylase [Gillisia sp. Hel_I_86]TVZ26780.1 purine-nucleoside phosphorylase [Gillisia sp. Hel_I_86]